MPDLRVQPSDLVPLPLAASLTYFQLAGISETAGTDEHLRDVLELAIVALSYIAPIHQASAGDGGATAVLSSAQVEELLFAPIRQGRPAADLDRFFIRRCDLHDAIASLRRHL